MSSYYDSSSDFYCKLCEKLLNPPIVTCMIYSIDTELPSPVCSFCLPFIEKIGEIISTYNLKWAELSSLGEKWMKACGAWSFMQNSEGNISAYLKIQISPSDEESIHKDVMTGRTDPEIFEREYHELIKRIMKNTYRQDICNVLRAYCARNPTIGYCQGMSYVTMWLLLFLDCNSALWTLSFLVEKWLLPDFYIGAKHGNSLNGFYIESSSIAGILDKCVPAMIRGCLTSGEFSDFFSLQLLIQLFVNVVDLESCIYLWGKLMSEGSIALIRGVVSLVSISTTAIVDGQHPLTILKTLIENHNKPALQEEYQRLSPEISEARVETLRKQSREYRARQWQKCEKIALHKLQKVSNFKEDEIKELSQIFMNFIERADNSDKKRYTVRIPQHAEESFDKAGFESGIRKDQFMEIIANINPNLETSAGLIFDRFDEDKSGLLDFRELIICVSVMCKGDFDDKLKMCFDAYDEDKSGFLQPNEMEMLVESLIKSYNKEEAESLELNVNQIKQRMRMICEKSGDILFFRDFLLAVKSDALLYSCFCDHLSVKTESIQQFQTMVTRKKSKDYTAGNRCQSCSIV